MLKKLRSPGQSCRSWSQRTSSTFLQMGGSILPRCLWATGNNTDGASGGN
ncbi:MAG: hypothetical protein IJ849_01585 [Selenomonadaceae bacterium]|nr:hypothetical protein [Selenomonadaceae bacterium]